MTSATMKLLKGGKKEGKASKTKLTLEQIQEMSGAELSEYVLKNKLKIEDFSKMKVAEKREALAEALKLGEKADKKADKKPDKKAGKSLTSTSKSSKAKQEVLDPDPVASTVHEMENLVESEVTERALALMEDMEFNSFQLGGVLSRIQEMGWFGEHQTLKEYAQEELGLRYRKAMYLIEIFDGLVELNIPWDKVKGVGWSKLRYLLPVLTSKNAASWAKKAMQVNTIQLQEMVKEATASGESSPSSEAPSTNVSTMSFKVHDDQRETIEQAIEKAKEQSGTDVQTVALEHICIEFVGSPDPKKVNLAKEFKKLKKADEESALTAVLEAFDKAWPEIELVVRMPGADDEEDDE